MSCISCRFKILSRSLARFDWSSQFTPPQRISSFGPESLYVAAEEDYFRKPAAHAVSTPFILGKARHARNRFRYLRRILDRVESWPSDRLCLSSRMQAGRRTQSPDGSGPRPDYDEIPHSKPDWQSEVGLVVKRFQLRPILPFPIPNAGSGSRRSQ